jgi:hypothetical protein
MSSSKHGSRRGRDRVEPLERVPARLGVAGRFRAALHERPPLEQPREVERLGVIEGLPDARPLGDAEAVQRHRGHAARGDRPQVVEKAVLGLSRQSVDQVDVHDEPDATSSSHRRGPGHASAGG